MQSFLNLQLYGKALDLFEDDQSISVSKTFGKQFLKRCTCELGINTKEIFGNALQVILHRHLLRTTAAPIVDMLFHNLVKLYIFLFIVQIESRVNDGIMIICTMNF